MTKRVVVEQGTDELGGPEEFTWNLYLQVETNETKHLEENGLPKKGTQITPGMILVGKCGRARSYEKSKPERVEIHYLSYDELRRKYGHMWVNTSLYATDATAGTVRDAYIEEFDGRPRAVVVLED